MPLKVSDLLFIHNDDDDDDDDRTEKILTVNLYTATVKSILFYLLHLRHHQCDYSNMYRINRHIQADVVNKIKVE